MSLIHSNSTLRGRADLLRLMKTSTEAELAEMAVRLGFQQIAPSPDRPQPSISMDALPSLPAESAADFPEQSNDYPNQIEDIALWIPTEYRPIDDVTNQRPEPDEEPYWEWKHPPPKPQLRPLAPWRTLKPRIRKALSPRTAGQRIDLNRLVRRIARLENIRRLPRQKKRRWNQNLFVIRDQSLHLAPYFEDQRLVIERLKRLIPRHAMNLLIGRHPTKLYRETGRDQFEPFQPPAGSQVLILGDLGLLDQSGVRGRHWYSWLAGQNGIGSSVSCLFPGSVQRIPASQLRQVRAVSWQTEASFWISDARKRESAIEQLLVFVACTFRVEPGLLRALRSLDPELADATLESEFWQHAALARARYDAAELDPEIAVEELRPRFDRLSKSIREEVLATIRRWRTHLTSPELWFEEIHNLTSGSRELIAEQDRIDAVACWRFFDRALIGSSVDWGLKCYAREFSDFATEPALDHPEVGEINRRIRKLLHPNRESDSTTRPEDVDANGPERALQIEVFDDLVRIHPKVPQDGGQCLHPARSLIRTSNDVLRVRSRRLDSAVDLGPAKPPWAVEFGNDEYGYFAEFEVKSDNREPVRQRMRWIEPGKFMMGSPADEYARESNERRHPVRLTRGYWLADTACTQELWEWVMGSKPSHFSGSQNPVESISFEDVEQFLGRLRAIVADGNFSLPTEAQWEYACRAGTQSPFSFGETITAEQANFWSDAPYREEDPKGKNRQETVSVKELPCNEWGLYQMHGNVDEWCSDWYAAELSAELVIDPAGPTTGSDRVVRGGSWINVARILRSACRSGYSPGYRIFNLGFRLLSSATGSAETSEGAQGPVAEQGSERASLGEADEIFGSSAQALEDEPAEIATPDLPRIWIHSNLEEWGWERLIKPDWAVDFGRDHFGIFADFEIEGRQPEPVRQRMRWITPGRFKMGSPDEEPGRYDDEVLHPVRLTHGFWIFDAPCSQALWMALREGENPSHFVDPERPVEQVSWEEAVQFADQLTEVLQGSSPDFSPMRFHLPTEAQWEYACRSGTQSAVYSGPIEILGSNHAPALDPISWYGGNCGEPRFDLKNGIDASGWEAKQYDFKFGGTRKIKQKIPNRWGLYDMLGNVWEWCRDWYEHDLSTDPAVNPVGPESGSLRVVRGGCWDSDARALRSACRVRVSPGGRSLSLGFRLLSSAKSS